MRKTSLFFCWSLLFLLPASAAQQLMWQTRAPMPVAVQEIYPAAHQGKIYVAGGLSDAISETQLQMSDAVQIYDPQYDRWSLGPALPEPRHHAYLLSTGDKLFVLGGFVAANGGRWSASADILLLDETNANWQKVASLPKPLTETVAVVIENRIHLVSGRSPHGQDNAQWRDQADVNWHWQFDPASYSFSEAQPLPQLLNSATGISWQNQLYVVGGRQVGAANLAAFYRYDLQSDNWQRLPDLPQAQGGLATAALDEQMLVFGGEFFTDGGGVYPQVWHYSFQTNRWQQMGEMPLPRHGLGAVVLNNVIYVLGGATAVGLKATSNQLEAVSLDPVN